jgi:hypothetical protein
MCLCLETDEGGAARFSPEAGGQKLPALIKDK